MAKKKKEVEEEMEDEFDFEAEEDQTEDDYSTLDDEETYDFGEGNTANNAMEYASIVSTPSHNASQFKHVPKETRYSFLEKDEAKEIKHWDKNYRRYQYLRKVLKLQEQEDIQILQNRMKLYDVEDEEGLKKYCEVNNLLMSYNMIKHNPELIKELIKHIKQIQRSGYYEDIINQNNMIIDIYSDHKSNNKLASYIDDLGMAGNIFTSSVVSMGRDGNERNAQVTTISATKEIDLKREQEEKSEYKSKLSNLVNKFR